MTNNKADSDVDTMFLEDDDSDNDEIIFDTKDLGRLDLLEKYRSNLMASATSSLNTDKDKNTQKEKLLSSATDEEMRI